MKTNKPNYLWPFLLALVLALGIVLGGFIERRASPNHSFNIKARNKINRLIDLIENEYVDNVDTDSIIDLTMNTLLSQLDPHSVYIAQDEMEEVGQSMKGSFVGIGINYNTFNDTVAIIKPIPGGPSDKAGLLAGDRILYADQIKIYGESLSNDSLVGILKGQADTKVKLKIFRKKTNQYFDVNVTRGEIPLKSVDASIKINDTLGYIKINRFSETTYNEFKSGMDQLLKSGIKALVIDLRDNGGGYVEPAVKIADEFLEKGSVIVKTVNKKGSTTVNKASSSGDFMRGSLFVLINENTASASEIIAGAIQDNDRGLILGRRSYGKGLVQREVFLGDGSAVRLTTARYYTPSGRSIQKPYNNYEDYNAEVMRRFESGELYERDSIHLADSLQFKTKSGRIVYGGGGIVPDVFVPLKSKHGEDAIQLLMKTGLVSYFVFEEIDKERIALEKMPLDVLAKRILTEPKYYNRLKQHLVSNGLTFNLDRHKKSILFYLVAEYINQLKSDEDYYSWILREDAMISKIK